MQVAAAAAAARAAAAVSGGLVVDHSVLNQVKSCDFFHYSWKYFVLMIIVLYS